VASYAILEQRLEKLGRGSAGHLPISSGTCSDYSRSAAKIGGR
jgi:hypothetical protein